MSLVTIPGGFMLPPAPLDDVSGSSSSEVDTALNGLDRQVFMVCQIPKVCTIKKIGFKVTAESSFIGTAEARIETIDAVDGEPTGTLVAAGANGVFTPVAGTTFWVTLTTPPTLSAGDAVGIGVRTTAYTSGSYSVKRTQTNICDYNAGLKFPFIAAGGASATKYDFFSAIGVELDDGSKLVITGGGMIDGANFYNWDNADNPDRRGLRFKLPFPARLMGYKNMHLALSDWKWILYDSDGFSVKRQSGTIDGNMRSTGVGTAYYPIDPVLLESNTYYRLVVLPLTASNRLSLETFTVVSATDLDTHPLGQDFHYTSVNGAPTVEGDWTNVTTERPLLSLFFDQIQTGDGIVNIME